MGFCIAEVVGPPNCLGTAKYIISVLLSKASVDCGGHELYGVKKRRAPQIGPTELQRGVFSFFVSYSADRRPPNHQGSSLSSQSIRRGPVGIQTPRHQLCSQTLSHYGSSLVL